MNFCEKHGVSFHSATCPACDADNFCQPILQMHNSCNNFGFTCALHPMTTIINGECAKCTDMKYLRSKGKYVQSRAYFLMQNALEKIEAKN